LNGGNRPDWWIRPNKHRIFTRIGMLAKQKQLKVAARILSISTGMFLFLNYMHTTYKWKINSICYKIIVFREICYPTYSFTCHAFSPMFIVIYDVSYRWNIFFGLVWYATWWSSGSGFESSVWPVLITGFHQKNE
jgi:hypothetical protein